MYKLVNINLSLYASCEESVVLHAVTASTGNNSTIAFCVYAAKLINVLTAL